MADHPDKEYIELPNEGKLFEILPNNARTVEIMRKRADEAEQARIKAEEMRQQKEREAKVAKNKQRMADADAAKREKARKEAEAKRQQEDAAQSQMDPKLAFVFEMMSDDQTPRELSLQGLELGPIRSGILSKWIGVNQSLMALDLNRMGVDDEQGKVIAMYLRKNTQMRSISLEGNMCGPKTAMEFGKTLQQNRTLKQLNLDSNQLAAENGSDQIGIYEFVEFLPKNTTLLSLSIANN